MPDPADRIDAAARRQEKSHDPSKNRTELWLFVLFAACKARNEKKVRTPKIFFSGAISPGKTYKHITGNQDRQHDRIAAAPEKKGRIDHGRKSLDSVTLPDGELFDGVHEAEEFRKWIAAIWQEQADKLDPDKVGANDPEAEAKKEKLKKYAKIKEYYEERAAFPGYEDGNFLRASI